MEHIEGQMDLMSLIGEFDPIKEVARTARGGWVQSERILTDLLKTGPDAKTWTAAVKHEYCPYGFCGHLWPVDGPNTLKEYQMMAGYIKVRWYDAGGDLRDAEKSWGEFSAEVAARIRRGEAV